MIKFLAQRKFNYIDVSFFIVDGTGSKGCIKFSKRIRSLQ